MKDSRYELLYNAGNEYANMRESAIKQERDYEAREMVESQLIFLSQLDSDSEKVGGAVRVLELIKEVAGRSKLRVTRKEREELRKGFQDLAHHEVFAICEFYRNFGYVDRNNPWNQSMAEVCDMVADSMIVGERCSLGMLKYVYRNGQHVPA